MNPNTILGKYLTKQIVLSFLSVLFMVMGIVLMFEVVELLRKTANHPEVGFGFVLKMSLAKLPRTIDMVFPFVMMIAAMTTFWKLSKSNEFVIIRASGVSIWGFMQPILFAVFVIGLINIMIVSPLSSMLFEAYETMEYRFKTKNPKAVLFTDKGLWIREAVSEDVFAVLKASNLRQDGDELVLRDVSIIEMDRKSQILRRLDVFVATLNDDTFDLKDVKIFKAGKKTISKPSLKYETTLTLSRIKENFVDPDAISFWKLPETIKFYETSGFSAKKHYMRYQSLIASPFLLCAMVLVAAVFALRPNNRRGGVMFLIVGGISTGFVVYFLSQIIYAFGMNAYIPSLLAVWAPTLIVGLVAVSVLLHLEDG